MASIGTDLHKIRVPICTHQVKTHDQPHPQQRLQIRVDHIEKLVSIDTNLHNQEAPVAHSRGKTHEQPDPAQRLAEKSVDYIGKLSTICTNLHK